MSPSCATALSPNISAAERIAVKIADFILGRYKIQRYVRIDGFLQTIAGLLVR